MRHIAEDVLGNAAKVLRKGAVRAGTNVVEATPVDTGLARSNWLASEESQDLSPRAPRTANATIAEIRQKVATIRYDSEIHITNGGSKVPYLRLLNCGWSRQAPTQFVRIAMLMAQAGLTEGERLLRRRRR